MATTIKLERRGRLLVAALAPVAVILGGNAIPWAITNLKARIGETYAIASLLLTALSVIVFVALEQNAKGNPVKLKAKDKPTTADPLDD